MLGNSITKRVFLTAWRVGKIRQEGVEPGSRPVGITFGEVADRQKTPLLGGREQADAAVRIAQPPRQIVFF